jgi:CBS domain-containing protein
MSMSVSIWMTEEPYCAGVDDHLDAVSAAMERGRFRHVPVVDAEGRLIGIVTDRDLRRHTGYLDTTKVSAAISEPAVAVGRHDSIHDAAQILLDRRIGGLPVIDGERRVIGILTTSDLLRGLLNGRAEFTPPATAAPRPPRPRKETP